MSSERANPAGIGDPNPNAEAGSSAAARRNAAALAYDNRDIARGRAPRVTAKGAGLIADEIIARARAAGVPIHESRELVSLLMQVDLDQHIPPVLYVAVAEVLAWVYRLEQKNAPASPVMSSDEAGAPAATVPKLNK